MGKYIIELDDTGLAYQTVIIDGTPYIKPLQLLSYTEPDLDAINNEAYEKGVQDTEQRWVDAPRSEEWITKGDVVRIKFYPEVEILVTCADEEYFSGIALTNVDDCCEVGDQYTDVLICNVEKTGEHYEIAEVLAKMNEED